MTDVADIDFDGSQTVEVDVVQSEIVHAIRTIYVAFLHFFKSGDDDVATPDFHLRIWKLMTSFDYKWIVIAVPRGHAKTTIAKLAVVYHFLFTPISFIVYVGNTFDLAQKAVCDIVDFFEVVNFIKIFGRIEYTSEKRGEGEFIFTLTTPFHGTKECILKARGCGQQLRGLNIKNRRPQMAVVDDLEDVQELGNEDLRRKNKNWFFGTFLKALDRKYNKVIMIGNLIDRNCILKQCIDSPKWHSMVLGAITRDGQPLWPELWSINDLIDDFQEYQRQGLTSLWFAEMMNLIIAGENAIIRPEQIGYIQQPEPGVCKYGFITIDPATGVGQNKTAIVLHLLLPMPDGNYIPIVADYRFGQFDESATVDIALSLCFEWGVRIVAIESVAYQRALKTLFDIIMVQRGVQGIEVIKTHPGHSSKSERIRAWAALLIDKAYHLVFGDLHCVNQLLAYDVLKKDNDDDLIDACAMGPEVLRQYLGLIMTMHLRGTFATTAIREGAFY